MRIISEGPDLEPGRIETRTYRVYYGLNLIADKEKWGGDMTVVEFTAETTKKLTGKRTVKKRLYVSSLPASTSELGAIIRKHWSVESIYWSLERNLL